jgi:hypothetical protein
MKFSLQIGLFTEDMEAVFFSILPGGKYASSNKVTCSTKRQTSLTDNRIFRFYNQLQR